MSRVYTECLCGEWYYTDTENRKEQCEECVKFEKELDDFYNEERE